MDQIPLDLCAVLAGNHLLFTTAGEEAVVLEEDQQTEEIIERVAALDIGKAELVCCARVPHESRPGRRLQDVATYSTMTRSLLGMSDHLRCLGVTRVVMEATSDYWKPVFYLLEAAGFETWLVNARDVKHLPGRPKTDRLDAVWLCKVAERQMLRSSFVPPPEIRRLRDVTRYRVDLIEARTAEKQRVEKLLEDAQIKLSVVASDIFGVSGRQMMAALIAGQTNPKTLAQLARGRMRTKLTILEDAFTGYFTDHHGFLLAKMLGRVDALSIDIAELEDAIEEMVDPFADAVERLDEIPGLGVISASAVIAEVGLDMTRFPTAAHLASWARFAPGVKESAGKKKGRGSTGHGNRYLARVLGEAAVAAARTDTFLGERYRRIARRRGKKKAVVAVGRSILVIIWHLLADPEARLIGAIGDVTGIWPLTHVGEYEGDVVAANIVGDARPANYEAVPRVTYTDPQAAAVGAVEAPYSATAPVSEVPKTATYTHAYAQSNGFLTLLSDGERLTGAYALGPEAGEWLQQATLAIRAHVPLEVLSDTIQPFLSFSGIYDAALMALRMEIADMPRPVRPMDAQMTGL